MEYTIKVTCPVCGNNSPIRINARDYNDWREGKVAQDAFPYLSMNERETMISGLCADCQKKIFGE